LYGGVTVALDVGYRVRSLVTENFNLKLLSLGVALVLYSLVHGSQEAQKSLLLSVVAVTPIPPQIRVPVRGPRATLDELHADDVGSVQLDLRSGNETRKTFDPSMVP